MVVNDRQTLLDVALQVCGSAEGVIDLALLNNLQLSVNLDMDKELNTLVAVYDKQICDYYAVNSIMPCTTIGISPDAPLLPTGINFMGIEIDFVVS